MKILLLLLACCAFSLSAAPVKEELGLVELPVAQASSAPMVVFMSGDGGWAALDKGLSAQLQQHGMPVVGWSSLTYYWKKKDPQQVTADLVRILDDYQSRWGRQRWLLVGFSFGA
ncbi:TPA: AcvB/VirJ family lysyl-phosphatidylglycerol hydrolase, partial [Aeromonas hydrophila]